MFESGVSEYIKGRAVIYAAFPVDMQGNPHVNCMFCRYFGKTGGICRITSEIVLLPEKYIGAECPLEFDKEEK